MHCKSGMVWFPTPHFGWLDPYSGPKIGIKKFQFDFISLIQFVLITSHYTSGGINPTLYLFGKEMLQYNYHLGLNNTITLKFWINYPIVFVPYWIKSLQYECIRIKWHPAMQLRITFTQSSSVNSFSLSLNGIDLESLH